MPKSVNPWHAGFAVLAGCVAWWWALLPAPLLTIWFLDVGQGDSIVIQTPSGRVLVVDTGGRAGADDMGRRVVIPFLRSHGIQRVDTLVLTHPDEDHIAGAVSLLERFPTGELLVSGVAAEKSETYRAVLRKAKDRHIPTVVLERGERLKFGDGVTAEVLSPTPDLRMTDNDGSVMLRVRYGGTSALLTGDAEEAAESDIVSSCAELHADLLKIAHHGSKTSTTERFLTAVSPRVAVVSCGRHNLFGHPHPSVMTRLAQHGIRALRTDENGQVTVTSDGARMQVGSAIPMRR